MEMGKHQSCCFFLSLESKLLKFLPVHPVHPFLSLGVLRVLLWSQLTGTVFLKVCSVRP